MITFIIIAAILTLLALWVFWRALGSDPDTKPRADNTGLNIEIARQRLAELEAGGHASDVETEALRGDIERSLAQELKESETNHQLRRSETAGRVPAIMLLLACLPALGWWLYRDIGTPDVIANPELLRTTPARNVAKNASPNNASADALSGQASIESLLPQLEAKMEANPDDPMGWRLLGRTYAGLGRFDDAAVAMQRALDLVPQAPAVIAEMAEIKAMQADGALAGEPTALLEQALSIDPSHQRSRFMLAMAYQQQQRHAEALELYGQLESEAAGDPAMAPALEGLRQLANQSRQALGVAEITPSGTLPATAEPLPAAPGGAFVNLNIQISDLARAAVNDDTTLFIFARAQQGPPMPLAAYRGTASELPLQISLDESMAMMPNMSLAQFDTVVVGARLSGSGEPTAQSGDWFGEVDNVAVGAEESINIMIDRQVP